MDFNEKIAIVTGGSRGIGAAVVEKLASRGAKVFFTYSSSSDAANEIAERCGAVAIKCDQSDSVSISSVVDKIFAEYGKIDILVNNAGVTKDNYLMLMPISDWESVLNTNLSGAFFWTKCVAKKMYVKKSGAIVFVSSVSASVGVAGKPNYAASKGAMISFMRSAAAELGARGIRANAVCPGFIETDLMAKIPLNVLSSQKERIVLKRFGRANEVADAVVFLASNEASYITGQLLTVDGGLTGCM